MNMPHSLRTPPAMYRMASNRDHACCAVTGAWLLQVKFTEVLRLDGATRTRIAVGPFKYAGRKFQPT